MEDPGVADLCRTIAADAAAQAAETLRLAGEKVSARIAQAEEEAAREAAGALRQSEAAAALESKRILSKVQLESRKIELRGRERLIEEVMGRVRRRISGLVADPGYADLLKRLAVEGARELGEREIELLLPAGAGKRLDGDALREIADALARDGLAGASVSVSGDAAPGAGVIVRSRTGRVAVDNTLEARIGRMVRELRLLISKTLFG
ncbi:MAG: V-type ATP synthase subunit E family protein [Chlamydiota bacterium]